MVEETLMTQLKNGRQLSEPSITTEPEPRRVTAESKSIEGNYWFDLFFLPVADNFLNY